jgi:hypothetical protein|tara:strand:+ start:63 stop:473 length:411 start_codon:yes stop_codon:yes gene_type:complete
MTSRSIHRDKPKEAIFKTLVQDYFLENPSTKEATISIGKTKRTDAQNRLYWCWVDIMSKEIGYAKQEMHLILADMFLTKISFTTKKGKTIEQIPSTTELKVDEFIDYICEIDMLAGEQGIKLPHNDDYRVVTQYDR